MQLLTASAHRSGLTGAIRSGGPLIGWWAGLLAADQEASGALSTWLMNYRA